MKILNLTQHIATEDQVKAGVYEPKNKAAVQAALNFETIPSEQDIRNAATALVDVAIRHGATHVMIGGAPYLMGPLENGLRARLIVPMYAFSTRVSVETMLPDGSVKKTSEFRHGGFVEGAL